MPDDDLWPPARKALPTFGGPAAPPQGDRFARMATEEVDWAHERALWDRGVYGHARGTGDYSLRLDATHLAHEARSWSDLMVRIRRRLQSHGPLDRPEDARLFIDTATSAYGAERGDPDSALVYAAALEKELSDRAAAARQRQIDTRAGELRKDPFLRARLERMDRIRRLADETGVDYAFAEAFVEEYERLSTPKLPGILDPRGVPFLQAEAPLYGSAYLIKTYILPFTEVGALLGVYEAVTGRDILTGKRLARWERVLNVVAGLLPFVGGAVARGVKAGAKAAVTAVKALGETATSGGRAMARLAVELGRGMKPVLRLAAKLARLPAAKVQALLRRLQVASTASRALRLTAEDLGVAREVDSSFKTLDVIEAGARPGSRTASGVIEDGRAISKTQSGVMEAKRAAEPAASATASAARLSKVAQELIAEGYLPEALAALEKLGVKLTAKAAQQLKALGATSRDFLNLFHQSKGFHRVVADLLKGGQKEVGASFVMRFATRHPDILAKVKANPLNVAFEWGAGIKKTRRFGDIFAREVDIVVRGDAALGEGTTVYNELKSWTERTLRAAKGRKLPQQVVRDTALLDPHNIRWVFDASKLSDPSKIIDIFVEVIQRDAYLSKAWGTDRTALEAALKRVVVVF